MKKESERIERQMNVERTIKQQEDEDYRRRETNQGRERAQGIIPQAVSPP